MSTDTTATVQPHDFQQCGPGMESHVLLAQPQTQGRRRTARRAETEDRVVFRGT